ncbi:MULTISPECIES: YjjW family glycine radical enzyme activase [Vibrio]|uniref:YjjW family glycine radical enzyme activase n=1 Tax=Vibrio TaxID=662 RepID=UPI00207606C1|nr:MULTISPECIES: YjjW family glycine radical enzyme activase [Vibrio]USD31333.1 YjjW family glycine radical enzyme activase [Vibrio sp. SCSIO 43186]USD44378.1 YjjW family glycine radical enzyme activase [Vibrio sp. SCSIO 43145]USD68456.1 YjjW family glycine radical enzyme activase [Vibrio sp. SCSIO 43139]USD96142.1 YjjW family glycine radical enzyme activase [Vibrio coralliilyticus]
MSERQAIVSRILKFSCVDGPGNRLVLFLQGCNFNCINCHNPHTINYCNHCGDCVEGCPENALSFDTNQKVVWDESKCTHCDQCIDVCTHRSSPKVSHYSVSEIIELINEQKWFISGITISGGEATMQLPFIIELFKCIKADSELSHLTCFIDSNGYLSQSGWDRVLPYLDGAMIDLKSWQEETHHWLVGRDNHKVVQSIRYLAEKQKLHELRLLHIPNRSDLDKEVTEVARLINTLPDSVNVRLNAFQHHGVMGKALEWPKCTESQMLQFHDALRPLIHQNIQLPSVYV